ncbi:MAG: hypothetical protein CSB15_01175 [Clostridiales bacterium]|nr:MAG: hypothetical protein CSB15_01175 [Clostridiales bacterium]
MKKIKAIFFYVAVFLIIYGNFMWLKKGVIKPNYMSLGLVLLMVSLCTDYFLTRFKRDTKNSRILWISIYLLPMFLNLYVFILSLM